MYWRSRTGEGYVRSGCTQLVTILLHLCPVWFGCQRVTLATVVSQNDFENLLGILQKLNAVIVAEAHTPAGELDNYYFRIETKLVAVMVEEYEPVKIIAPRNLVGQIQKELAKLPASDGRVGQ
jgi:p-aminobenzoyl-glutamate transporter AbgT